MHESGQQYQLLATFLLKNTGADEERQDDELRIGSVKDFSQKGKWL